MPSLSLNLLCYHIWRRYIITERPINGFSTSAGAEYKDTVAESHRIDPADALERAETLCRKKGAKLTDLRRRALQALAEAGRPVKAYDLLPALGDEEAPAKPATAYRALEFLEELGLVHKVAGINAFVMCAHGGGSHVTCLFVCEECGAAEERVGHAAPGPGAPKGFEIERSVVEHYGRCASCAA
jgi:Fur family zinc uptake transcriptional regulator